MSIQTIVLSYQSDQQHEIHRLQKQLSIATRYAYKRSKDGWTQIQTRNTIESLNNVSSDAFLNQCAVANGYSIHKLAQDGNQDKVIFGSRKNLELRSTSKISNEQWKQSRLLPIHCIGESNQKGNRKFKLDINNNQIIFKLTRTQHITLNLPYVSKNYRKLLEILQKQCEMKENCFTVKLTDCKIYISFEQLKQESKKLHTRYAGIDLNPNYVGFVICENNKVIYQKLYNLIELNKLSTDKMKHEKVEICKDIHRQLVHWQVSRLCIEDLSIKSQQHNKGKTFNKLVNNKWNRKLISEQLIKRCDISGIYVKKVNPAYSSFIGNLLYQLPDALSSALEIARRGSTTSSGLYPELINIDDLANRWKEELNWSCSNWKELYLEFKSKNLLNRYRVSMSQKDLVFKPFIARNTHILSYINDNFVYFML